MNAFAGLLRVEVVSRDEIPVPASGASYEAIVLIEMPEAIDRTSRILVDVPADAEVHRLQGTCLNLDRFIYLD